MRQVSQEFRSAVQRNTNVAVKATLALADGTELDLVNSDFVIGSVSFDEATSSTGSFDIGSAIVGQFKATIANYDGKFSRYDFSGSTITPSVGTVVNGTMEWLQIGVYDIDRPTSTGRSIEIQAYDKLNSMKVALNTVGISYPTTLGDIALKLCDACGVTLESSAFPNNDYQVRDAPKLVDSDTCLSGIAWVAQIACCYVKCSNLGHIVLDWYDPADFKDAANLDGGTFNTRTVPYSDGDAADGGTFDDYSSGVKVDAGEFSNRRFWVLARNQQSKVSTDDVTITGVSVTAQDEETSEGGIAEKGETALSGKTGYVLSISGNKFVSFGTAQRVADLIAPNVVGLKFRTFSASTLGNPVMECGDAVYVTDYTANAYRSYITQLTYTVGSYESVACNAETPTHKAAINASASTQTLQEVKRIITREHEAREAALNSLAEKISEKAGLYSTKETLQDGSAVYYLHDAETIGRSKVIWKMTAAAIGVSVDGGKTYTAGMTADGNAILNRIYAVGINADYINTGTITVSDSSGIPILKLGDGAVTGLSVRNPFTGSGFVSLSKYAFSQPAFSFSASADSLTTSINLGTSSGYVSKSDIEMMLPSLAKSKSVNEVIYKDFETTDTGFVIVDVSAIFKGESSGSISTYTSSEVPSSSQSTIATNSYLKLDLSITDKASGDVCERKEYTLMSGTSLTSDGSSASELDVGNNPQSIRYFFKLDANKSFRASIDASVSTSASAYVGDAYMTYSNYEASHKVNDICVLVTPCGE